MTTKRMRLEAAIANEIADRHPVALWRHFPVDDQVAESLAEATAQFQREYDFDLIKVTPASSFCIRDWGVEDQWNGAIEGTRDYTRRVVLQPKEWAELPPLDPKEGYLGEQLRCLTLLREKVGQDVPIIQTIFNPLAQAKNLAGQENLTEHLHKEPECVLTGLETITRSTIEFVGAALGCGIDGIFYAIQHASYRYFDRESYRVFGENFDQRILETIRGCWLNVLHLHGESLHFELAKRYPVQVVNWHDRTTWPNLEEGKRMIKTAVCGGIQRETMFLGNPDTVVSQARQAIGQLKGGGLILGTGCVVFALTPRANLRAARDAVDFA
jgi:uroporphyrinogen decarboxylase